MDCERNEVGTAIKLLQSYLDQMMEGNILTVTMVSGEFPVVYDNNWDIREDNGQMGTEVEIRLQMSHNLKFRQEFGQSF